MPADIDYLHMDGISIEARQKLDEVVRSHSDRPPASPAYHQLTCPS